MFMVPSRGQAVAIVPSGVGMFVMSGGYTVERLEYRQGVRDILLSDWECLWYRQGSHDIGNGIGTAMFR